MTAEISINIKSSTDTGKVAIQISPAKSVADLKHQISQQLSIPVDLQRLIFSGKILKDDDLISTYKIADGNTIHLVKGKPKVSETVSVSQAAVVAPPVVSPPSLVAANPMNQFMSSFAASQQTRQPQSGQGAGIILFLIIYYFHLI